MQLSDECQSMAANAIAHAAQQAGYEWAVAGAMHGTPSAVWKPKIFIDGNQWCALYGENLQDGVAGFGDSPSLAMFDFDKAWHKKLSAA
jgi:hypothetical protein